MKTFNQYIGEGVTCPEGTRWCKKCGKCLEVPCQDKEMKEGVGLSVARAIDKTKPPLGRPSLRRRISGALKMREVEISSKGRKYTNKGASKTTPAAKTIKTMKEWALNEGAAWTKKEGQNSKGGLNEKGRKSYERENPGSDLKAPSKKVGNPRRASFCARMKGMRKRQKPSNNTGDDRLSKSLRAWNC